MTFNFGTIKKTSLILTFSVLDKNFKQEVSQALHKYINCNWGDIPDNEKDLNNRALVRDEDIVAKYKTSKGEITITTSWNRAYTIILFSYEM